MISDSHPAAEPCFPAGTDGAFAAHPNGGAPRVAAIVPAYGVAHLVGEALTHTGKPPNVKFKSLPPVLLILKVCVPVCPHALNASFTELAEVFTTGAGNVVPVKQTVVSCALFVTVISPLKLPTVPLLNVTYTSAYPPGSK